MTLQWLWPHTCWSPQPLGNSMDNQINTAWNNPELNSVLTGLSSNSVPGRWIPTRPPRPGWKGGESNTDTAGQIFTQFLHINIGTQNLYQLLCRFIQIQIHGELTKVERQQMIVSHYSYQTLANMRISTIIKHKLQNLGYCFFFSLHQPPRL